ncbi:MAG: malonate decarboxylase subunit beta, partial [Paenibacillaceae bacterium]|nr:malonate decarboxylase subunit beta [Paenibacillaceae bacterium]
RLSMIELCARERARALLDPGSFRELLDPFERMESPHLAPQGIVPQSDDGVTVARGTIDAEPAVVISIEGSFLGGGIGEVSGAKIAGALELALRDNEQGVRVRPVLLLDTGGVRLQEANFGLLAIAEICAAVAALRRHIPVVAVIPGMIGCFGGMSIVTGLCSHVIMTREGRLGLNGPEVIELEAGIQELDSTDRLLIWKTIGGARRCAKGLADGLVDDDAAAISDAVRSVYRQDGGSVPRCTRAYEYLQRLSPGAPPDVRNVAIQNATDAKAEDVQLSRGKMWFHALTGNSLTQNDPDRLTDSVLCADVGTDGERVRYIAVVPDLSNPYPRARNGEVGLVEGWTIARYVKEAIEEDADGIRRAIVLIVDVPGQAYGFVEELLGLHQACAAAVDAYAAARIAGHPLVALLVGNAISGAFLAHGLQANLLLAFNDPQVNVQVMSKKSAARVTRRTIAELEAAAKEVPATAYDIRSFAKLGALDRLIDGIDFQTPGTADIRRVREEIAAALAKARRTGRDLRPRLSSAAAITGRPASIRVRERLSQQWTLQ